MRSRLPAAAQFTDWVVSEVLPTIRKHGGNVAPHQGAAEAFIAHYLPNLDAKTRGDIFLSLSKRVDELQAENQVMAPKAMVYDLVVADKNEKLTMFFQK